MKLSAYIKELQKLAKKYPNAEVVYAADDEGNGFEPVKFAPSVGCWENGEFESDDKTEEFESRINAVCLN